MVMDAVAAALLRRQAERDRHVMDMINCKENPITREDLHALADKYPRRWERYRILLDKK